MIAGFLNACISVNPVNGAWGNWGTWSCCNSAGQRTRARQCNNPEPADGGETCATTPTGGTENQECIDGNWGEWSPYSICTAGKMQQTRTRQCDKPEPKVRVIIP